MVTASFPNLYHDQLTRQFLRGLNDGTESRIITCGIEPAQFNIDEVLKRYKQCHQADGRKALVADDAEEDEFLGLLGKTNQEVSQPNKGEYKGKSKGIESLPKAQLEAEGRTSTAKASDKDGLAQALQEHMRLSAEQNRAMLAALAELIPRLMVSLKRCTQCA